VTPGAGEVQYLALPDAENPYLLARVRWPDVFQAISAARPDWVEDQGLFDLPYDPNSTPVTVEQAGAIAAGWGARLPSGESDATHVLSLIRRMPADWSNMSPAEKRAWSLEFVRNGRPTIAPSDRRRLIGTLAARLARWLGVAEPADVQEEMTHEPPGPAVEVGSSDETLNVMTESMPPAALTSNADSVAGDDGGLPPMAEIVSLPPVSHHDAEPLVDEPAS
jgi:hypothetical protein